MKRVAVLLICLGPAVLAAGPAAAVCEDTSTNVAYKDCVRDAADAAEAELEAVLPLIYAEIFQRDYMSIELRQLWASRMRAGQRAFEAYREIDCLEATTFEWWGGSGAGGAASLCRYEKTVARSRDLVTRFQLDAAIAPVAMEGAKGKEP
ncbi:MAG: lysozyme inhibitor LprI family protein [Pseudomonadota bacterium]